MANLITKKMVELFCDEKGSIEKEEIGQKIITRIEKLLIKKGISRDEREDLTQETFKKLFLYLKEEIKKPKWENYDDEHIEKIVGRKIKDGIFGSPKEGTLENIRTREIDKWKHYQISKLKKLFYMIYSKGKITEDMVMVEFKRSCDPDHAMIFLELGEEGNSFCDFVLHNPKIRSPKTIRLKKKAMQCSIEHEHFTKHEVEKKVPQNSTSRRDTEKYQIVKQLELRCELESASNKKREKAKKFFTLMGGETRKEYFRVYSSTKFELLVKNGKNVLSLEIGASYFPNKKLFTDEHKGNLFGCFIGTQRSDEQLQDHHGAQEKSRALKEKENNKSKILKQLKEMIDLLDDVDSQDEISEYLRKKLKKDLNKI